jgi:hypothetical protein
MPKCMPKSMPKSNSMSMRKCMSNSRLMSNPTPCPNLSRCLCARCPYDIHIQKSKNYLSPSLWCPNAEGKWPLGVPMVSQRKRQMTPWCAYGVPSQKANGPMVSQRIMQMAPWCPYGANAKGKWPHSVPMVSQRRRQMAPWSPYGVSTLKANGPMVSLWCPYSESKWPHGVPLVSLC